MTKNDALKKLRMISANLQISGEQLSKVSELIRECNQLPDGDLSPVMEERIIKANMLQF